MNLVHLTLLVAAVTVGYLGWLWVPLWLDDLDVHEAVAVAISQLGEGQSEERVRTMVAGRLGKVGFHFEEQNGAQVEVPGLGVDPGDLQIERHERSAKVTLDYSRTVKLKPLERYYTFHFHTGREGILQ